MENGGHAMVQRMRRGSCLKFSFQEVDNHVELMSFGALCVLKCSFALALKRGSLCRIFLCVLVNASGGIFVKITHAEIAERRE